MRRLARTLDPRGFTLPELLVAVGIVGIIMSALLGLVMGGQTSYLQGSNRADALQSTRVALARMMDEVRGAGFDPTSVNFAAITAPTTSGFTLQNDWNGNGVIEPAVTVTVGGIPRGEQVTYSITGNLLQRQESNIDGAPVTIAPVGQVTFQYLDRLDAVTTTPADIRTIVATVDSQPQSQGATTLQGRAVVAMTDRARLRNR
jgi:prepilin-type N-terminal cleavage/methylation domain-containing protein